jgi:chloramphenicol O-acetyltransferase type A
MDVTRVVKVAKKKGYKLNMLMCWCIGKAATTVKEFYLLPVGDKLIEYDKIAVSAVIATKQGGITSCDVPFTENIEEFNQEYLKLSGKARETGERSMLGDEYMVVGTSAVIKTSLDGVVNLYSGVMNNPFVVWSKYEKKFLKKNVTISFQFHHTQMDGGHASQFLINLQQVFNSLK